MAPVAIGSETLVVVPHPFPSDCRVAEREVTIVAERTSRRSGSMAYHAGPARDSNGVTQYVAVAIVSGADFQKFPMSKDAARLFGEALIEVSK